MRILLANSTCKVGGVSTFMLSMPATLASLGHECELFFFSRGTMEAHLPAGCLAHFGTLADCLALVQDGGFDVVHANNIDWTTGISAVRQAGTRLVLTAHKARESAWTYGWDASNCDALAAVSRGVAERLQPFTDVPIQIVHNGIDTERFTPHRFDLESNSGSEGEDVADAAAEAPVVAWIGRSGSPLKGFERFASLAPALQSEGFRIWVLDQHGPTRAAEAYPAAVATLEPIAERWEAVAFDAMPDLYRTIARGGGCVLSTSTAEGLPLTLLEAQACGCVVVASDVAGNDECVLPSHGGVRYPLQLDDASVARLVVDTLSDGLRARQRAAAQHVHQRFSLQRMATHYVRLYEGTPDSDEEDLPRRRSHRLSPLLHWGDYLEQRVGVGYEQLACSRLLADSGRLGLARDAGLAAWRTSPTIFLRLSRLAHLARVLKHRGSSDDPPHHRGEAGSLNSVAQ